MLGAGARQSFVHQRFGIKANSLCCFLPPLFLTRQVRVHLLALARRKRGKLEFSRAASPVLFCFGQHLRAPGRKRVDHLTGNTPDLERAIDRIPESRRPSYFELAEASADQSISLHADVTRKLFFNDLNESQAAAYHARLTPQPLGVYLEESPFDLSTLTCPRHYLACRDDQALGLESNLLYAARLGGTTRILEAGHDVMLSEPDMLAQVLMALPGRG